MIPETVPAALAKVGDPVIVGGYIERVTAVQTFDPWEHAGRVHGHFVARRVVTTGGERWFGHAPGDRYRGMEILFRAPGGVSFEVTS